MFENTDKIDLAKTEKLLERSFDKVELLGQLRLSNDDYLRVSSAAKETLNQKPENLEKIPERVFLALMIFCARYEDTYSSGYWPVFLNRLGLRNEGSIQNACRQRFKEALGNLEHLYFPTEGYKYVTPILFHAVIPQVCVPEMASLLHEIGQDAGWDAVAELEIGELERQLPTVVKKVRATKALTRFVNNTHSRHLAAQFVHDLCEAAHLHQRGVFRLQDIESLLEPHPVQREVWDKLMGMGPRQNSGTTISRSLFVAPRWQWDIRARQMRLFFPRQNIAGGLRPASFVVRKERYPVEVEQQDSRWQVNPTCLMGMPMVRSDAQDFSVELRAENDARLRTWTVNTFNERALFFKPEASGTVASLVPHERGLSAGEWLVLIRRNLCLLDADGVVSATREWYSPRGFEEYQALSVVLSPPLTIFAANDPKEELERIPVAEGSSRLLQLDGQMLRESDDPSGAATFTGSAPDVLLAAQSWEEIRNLQLQLRELTTRSETEVVAQIYSIQNLRHSEIAHWSETKHQLRIHLNNLLPEGVVGRFRLKILRGLQSAQYLPMEFNLVPTMRVDPPADEIDQTLYTAEEPPMVQVACSAVSGLTSRTGSVTTVMPGIYRIEWSTVENEFEAILRFGDFSLPVRWHPHILRAGIYSKTVSTHWETQPLTVALEKLSFAHIVNVEGIPEATYQIYAGEVLIISGRFNAQSRLQFPLANLTDYVKRSAAKQVPVRIIVKFGKREHQLLLLMVYKNSAGTSEFTDGEPIRYLRVGQQTLHPDYGLGALEAFTEISVCGEIVSAARFQFDRYPGVSFFIPATRRLPVYGYRQIAAHNNPVATVRVRTFVVGEKTNNIEGALSQIGGQL